MIWFRLLVCKSIMWHTNNLHFDTLYTHYLSSHWLRSCRWFWKSASRGRPERAMHDFHDQWAVQRCVCRYFLQNNREVKHHVYVKRQTRLSTTWPSFLFTCRLLFIISTTKFWYIYTLYSFCHLRPQIARARRGGRRGKATAVINIKSQEAGTIILQSKLNKLCE